MMNKIVFLTVLNCAVFSLPLISNQTKDDPVLLKVNGREITISEFEYVYTKNNLNPQVMDPKSIDEYLELFINFNLKVYEALQLGLDTHQTFINELAGYRKQLAQPYLTDQEVTNHLIEEAYERMQYDIRASHILFNLEKHASPNDTLAAWNKAMEVRKRIMAGESFEKLAMEYSDDPSAKGMAATPNRPASRGNSGDLGYFSVMLMVYPFESAAFNLEIGEISMPVRSDFGYHIIRLTDKLPAMGSARVAHIMVMFPQDADQAQIDQAQSKIEEIYQNLQQGEDFESLAERFSDDKASGRRGGEMPAFTSNRMVPEFIKAIADLNQDNLISKPVKTQFGWHIIKFIDRQLPSKEDAMADLKNKISRDSRSHLSKTVVIERLKKEYAFSQNQGALDLFFDVVDNTIFEGKWDKGAIQDNNEVMFSFADQKYTQKDFADYLSLNQTMRSPESIRSHVSNLYNNYVQEKLLSFEEDNLPNKYPEFRKIMNEYHDGILLFELTDQKVWGKAMADTAGLQQFFKDNIDNYMWEDRLDAVIYTFNSEAGAKSGRKAIRKAHRKNVPQDDLMAELNRGSQLNVSIDAGVFEIAEKDVLASVKPRKGVAKVINHKGTYSVIWINEYLPRQPKKLNEIRGLVIADYQNYLEEQWIRELRSKYQYVVNRDALKFLNTNQ
jgi:peptidyl-prolyl cis-trans isomerase SurA